MPRTPTDGRGPTAGVLALQGDVREHAEALRDVGVRVREVRSPDDLDGCDGLVVPGGESTAISHLILRRGLDVPLRAFLSSGAPVLGTCAGMILLAREVLDGRPDQVSFGVLDIVVRRNGYGRQNESFETDLEIDGDAEPLHGVFIRAPRIEAIGPDVEVLARHDGTAVLVRQGPVTAAAFHPEMSGDLRIHRQFADAVRARRADASGDHEPAEVPR